MQLPIELNQLVMVWGAILFAAILRSFTGFGFALAAVPIFSLFLTPVQAAVLCVTLSLGIGVITLPTYWDKNCFKPLVPLLLLSLIGTPIGALVLVDLPPRFFKLGIGICVVISCVFLAFCHPSKTPGKTFRPISGSIAGLLSGLLNGAFAIPGPPIIIYVMATEREAMRSRSMMITFFTLSSFLALTTYTANGFVSLQSISLFLFSMPAMYLGDRLGFLLLQRFGTTLYRRLSFITLFAIGILSLAQALNVE